MTALTLTILRRSWATRHRRRLLVLGGQVALGVVLLVAWEFFAGPPGDPHVLIDDYLVSQPSDIWAALVDWYARGLIWPNVYTTVYETVIGFLLGSLLGAGRGLNLHIQLAVAAGGYLVAVILAWLTIGNSG